MRPVLTFLQLFTTNLSCWYHRRRRNGGRGRESAVAQPSICSQYKQAAAEIGMNDDDSEFRVILEIYESPSRRDRNWIVRWKIHLEIKQHIEERTHHTGTALRR